MAHNATPHLFFAFFSAALLFFAGGGGGGVGYSAIRRFMPAHLQARYDAAAWLTGVAIYACLRLTAAPMSACLCVFFLGVIPITGPLLTYNSKEYSWDTKWARENPERAAVKAAAEAIENAAWWAAARYNAATFLGMMTATFALMAAMYFWTIPVLSFLFRHDGKIAVGGLVATILGIWGRCAYENYKIEVALKRRHAGLHDLLLLFHLICCTLFITAFIHFHTQAMAHIALVWGFTSVVGLIQYL
jgi:hypothetical protein